MVRRRIVGASDFVSVVEYKILSDVIASFQ